MRRLFVNKHLLALFLVCLSITTLTGFELINVLATPAPSRNSIATPGGFTSPCTYDFYIDGSSILAKNCHTGDNDYQGTDAYTVIQTVLNISQAGGTFYFETGIYTLSNRIWIGYSNTYLV